jgi:DNA repair protein RadA/Sms
MEGTRPVAVEIQALVVGSNLASPRRVAEGVKHSRLQVLVAVLTKRCGIKLYDKDVFVNVAGGVRIEEPGADLAVCLAIASSALERSVPAKVAAIGEVGLLGEVRGVGFVEKRAREAKKLGYTNLVNREKFKTLYEVVKKILK